MATAEIKQPDETIDEYTKPPFLRRVRIRNYKSIAFCDVTLEPLTVLVGRNGSGKSNFLDALAFLRDVVELNVAEAVRKRGNWSSLICRNDPEGQIVMDIDFGSRVGSDQEWFSRYRISIAGGDDIAPSIRHEMLGTFDSNGIPGFQSARTQSPKRKIELHTKRGGDALNSMIEHVMKHSEMSVILMFNDHPYFNVAAGLRQMCFYNFHPAMIRKAEKSIPGVFLESDGRNLASVIAVLAKTDSFLFNRAKTYLSHIAEQVQDFRVEQFGSREAIIFGMRGILGKPMEFEADSISDGTLRALASLIAVSQNIPPYGHPSVVGIEEPETSLHPAAVNALVDALDEATVSTQILLTTHSAELLDNSTIKPKNVRVVQIRDGNTIIGPVDAAGIEIVQRKLNTLGGLERDNLLEVDQDDLDRQKNDENMPMNGVSG